jgi:hypothetical protein
VGIAANTLIPALLVVGICGSAYAQASGQVQPTTDCRSAAQISERLGGLPDGLLLAIGQVETGRPDPLSGRLEPWPWSINDSGEGHYFDSAQQAIASVAARQALGSRSIDVGCFQVNLLYHPDAFANLAEAFDPAANGRYAAAFLNRLHEQSGSWATAIALYHSADPLEGQRYSGRVMQAWSTGGTFARIPFQFAVQPGDRVVIRLSAAAASVRVVVPSWAAAQPASAGPPQRSGLPRVFTPSG